MVRDFLKKFYTVSYTFKITRYYVFHFSATYKTSKNVKTLLLQNIKTTRLLKRRAAPTITSLATAENINTEELKPLKEPVNDDRMAQEKTRGSYLEEISLS